MLPVMAVDVVPYITVVLDERGSAVWQVVAAGMAVNCYCGQRALEVLRVVCASSGISVPQ
jgi:hypothetical protein